MTLTERQQREVEYHKHHAELHGDDFEKPISYDVLNGRRRWWNAYWEMFYYLRSRNLKNHRSLVIGCGFGEDAIRLARLGALVDGIDLSPEMLAVATKVAARENAAVQFHESPAEHLPFADKTFDIVLARDILHHVDIPATLTEMRRVSKPDALWVINEVYSHSFTEKIRRSRVVEKLIYPALQRFVYGTDRPYITEDERKLTETDLQLVKTAICVDRERYFNFLVGRVLPGRWDSISRIDQLFLRASGAAARILGGRALLLGTA